MNNKEIKHDSVSRTEIHIQLKNYKDFFELSNAYLYRAIILENYLIL